MDSCVIPAGLQFHTDKHHKTNTQLSFTKGNALNIGSKLKSQKAAAAKRQDNNLFHSLFGRQSISNQGFDVSLLSLMYILPWYV